MGQIANRQSLAFSERSQLSQAIPQFHVERIVNTTNAGSTRTNFCVFRGRYDRQRALVIRIAAITLASDSAITIARFRPSKLPTKCSKSQIASNFIAMQISCASSRSIELIQGGSHRVHAKGVVLCERTCFCLLRTF